jgi:sialate O-acetylesterase
MNRIKKQMIVGMLALVSGLVTLAGISQSRAEEKLENGKDRIDVPAIAEELCLHNLFQSGMVLQRDKPIRIWGWAEPGENVSVTFGEKSQSSTAAADRSWTVEFPALSASSEPRTLVVQGIAKTIKLDDILLGDVWLLGGQSNMEFPIYKLEDGALEIASANFKNIRLFTVPQLNGPDNKKAFPRLYQWNDFFSEHFRQGYWDVCSPETVREMSGIGYIFARRLHMGTQIPIGVIDASRGGTCIETWLPLDLLKTIETPEVKDILSDWDKRVADFNPQKDLEARIKQDQDWRANMKKQGKEIPAGRGVPADLRLGPAMDMNRPGNCYASMIAPLIGFQIKGTIWHQGYNNALVPNGHVLYYQVFAKMIGAWRAAFNDPNMPFGIISLCTEGAPQDLDNYLEMIANEGIYIREVQYKTFLDFQQAGDNHIGFATSFDQRRAWYHPQIKIPVGERIAGWALVTQYGKSGDIRWLPPTIQETKIEGGKLFLKMARYEVDRYNDGPILGFAIAGKDGKFQPATAEWSTPNDPGDRTLIVLSSPLVAEPVFYRHAWGRNPLANLKASGIPLDTLRNDNFTIADMYEIYTGKKSATPNILNGVERRDLTNALKAEDVKRRFQAAEAFIKEHRDTNSEPK